MRQARVIGGGLSGLAAAACLVDAGYAVEVLEASSHVGGLIGTTRTPHGLVERAANAFVWNDAAERWFGRLGVTPVLPKPGARRRYIFSRGRPRRWPLTMRGSAALVARVGAAALTRRMRPRDTESVATYGARVFGRDATAHLIGPALQGIYAAPPERLSARVIFGGERRGRRVFAAPSNGMGEFIGRLHDDLRRRGVSFAYAARVERLEPPTPTIVCTNVREAAALVRPFAPALAEALDATAMTHLVTATAFFAPQAADLDGFGVLFPRDSHVQALGALFNTSVFEGRGTGRSETWIYGQVDSGDALPSPDSLDDQLATDRRRLTGRFERPMAVHATRWSPALPVYGPSILAIRERLADLPPWLALSGNYLTRGVSGLLEQAETAARRISSGEASSGHAR
jgi:protoporphyrinogen/coproporphyrinogen III oxidase